MNYADTCSIPYIPPKAQDLVQKSLDILSLDILSLDIFKTAILLPREKRDVSHHIKNVQESDKIIYCQDCAACILLNMKYSKSHE